MKKKKKHTADFNKLIISIASPESVLEESRGEVIKPEDLKQEEAEDPMLPYKQTGVNEGDKSLPEQDNKQDHNPAPTRKISTKV